jgi:hypothetical protein
LWRSLAFSALSARKSHDQYVCIEIRFYNLYTDGVARRWDPTTQRCLQTLVHSDSIRALCEVAPADVINGVAASGDGGDETSFALLTGSSTVKVWARR